MRIILTLLLGVMLSGCNPTQTKQSPAIIVADGTEVQQFEQVMFCGDTEAFVKASNLVHEPLKNAWDNFLGEENREFCSIKISLNEAGDIVDYSLIECENPDIIPEVIRHASPVPAPESKCLFDRIQDIKYTINGDEENS